MKGEQTISTEENKDIVRRFLDEAINKGNLAIADELLVEDYAQHSVMGVPQGREGFKQIGMLQQLGVIPT